MKGVMDTVLGSVFVSNFETFVRKLGQFDVYYSTGWEKLYHLIHLLMYISWGGEILSCFATNYCYARDMQMDVAIQIS